MTAVSAAVHGFFYTKTNIIERLILFISGIAMIDPSVITDIVGVPLIFIVIIMQWRRSKAEIRAIG